MNDPVRKSVVELVREKTEELGKQGAPCVPDNNYVREMFPSRGWWQQANFIWLFHFHIKEN